MSLASVALQDPATSASSSSARKLSAKVDVSGENGQAWKDSGIDVKAGDQISISAEAESSDAMVTCDPDGAQRGWRDLLMSYPVNAAGRGALVARIGNDDAAVPFLIGKEKQQAVPSSGRLYLGMNLAQSELSSCVLHATIKVTHRAASRSTATTLARLNSDFLQQVPRRVSDPDQRPGDVVNFILLGSEDSVQQVFQSAGWVSVDRTKEDATLHAILSTLSKGAYVEMPMSELYLFGRPQDYGMAHAEPIKVVTTRHHLRFWKAPFSDGTTTVWVGAATHDVGIERDQRNGGITHKIDPDVDGEREFLGKSLGDTGMLTDSYYLTPSDPVKDAKTATGGSFHTDGRVLVMALK